MPCGPKNTVCKHLHENYFYIVLYYNIYKRCSIRFTKKFAILWSSSSFLCSELFLVLVNMSSDMFEYENQLFLEMFKENALLVLCKVSTILLILNLQLSWTFLKWQLLDYFIFSSQSFFAVCTKRRIWIMFGKDNVEHLGTHSF